jgi:hypothetical protein
MQPNLVPSMPMAQAMRQPLPLADALAPLGQPTPPPQAPMSGAGAPPMPAQPGALPPAMPPQGGDIQVRMQPDGTSVYYTPSPDGDPAKDIIRGVNPPPKVQKGASQAPNGIPLAMQPPQPH